MKKTDSITKLMNGTLFREMEYAPERTRFCLNAPTRSGGVVVRVYDSAVIPTASITTQMTRVGKDRWEATIDGNLIGKYYTFELYTSGRYRRGRGECPGTFAQAVGTNGCRAAIIDMRATDPEGWEDDVRPQIKSASDLVIYELHYRDFSVHPDSRSRYAGLFLALTESHNLFYLKTLGVNAVQLMPSFDFASVDEARPDKEQYNWGYDPLNYNVPEGSYSTDASQPTRRINEFKRMVQSLHRAGIRVIMDVVYNHCMSISGSNFQRTYPDAYFRRMPPAPTKRRSANASTSKRKGPYANGSGCGNETASDRPLMRQYMVESVLYWVREYHVDGFRFDLMGLHDIETMNAIREALDSIDPTITMHGEGWTAGTCALAEDKRAVKSAAWRMDGVGVFADEMRDALRGPWWSDREPAYLAAKGKVDESLRYGLVGGIVHPQIRQSLVEYAPTAWALQPMQHIAYVTCHDDLCLYDRMRVSMPQMGEDELVRLHKLAHTFVLLSQGVPFILCGEELMRTKQGVRNSYKSPDAVNRIDWSTLPARSSTFLYFRGLIEMRHLHPAFRMGNAELVCENMRFLTSSPYVIAFMIDGSAVGDAWRTVICIMNSNTHLRKVRIPEGRYTVVCSGGEVNLNGKDSITVHDGDTVSVGAQEALIMYQS